jgi:hypothetical protein
MYVCIYVCIIYIFWKYVFSLVKAQLNFLYNIYIYIYIYMYIYIYIYIYIHIYIYIYIYIYIIFQSKKGEASRASHSLPD